VILEIVSLHVRAGSQAALEAAFDKARRLLPGVPGYASHELRRSLESDQAYVLLIEWHTLEDVTLGFRKSAEFVRWHQLLEGFTQRPPRFDFFGADIPGNEAETRRLGGID
jgi:heme-degrading monooxygenase HmoA